MYDYQIEVTVKEGDTSTQRGALLENIAKKILIAQQYDYVSTNVRVAGCELDVVGEQKQTGGKVIIECKAYRDKPIGGEVLRKLAGTLVFNEEYRAAWLITTGPLSKDAKGLIEQFRLKPVAERERLRVWGPAELIELLAATGQVVRAETLAVPTDFPTLDLRTLVITDIGEFWAVTAVGPASGVADTVLAFDAKTGRPVANVALLKELSARDSNLKGLRWLPGGDDIVPVGNATDTALRQELDAIASVPVADDWSDYRPARPEDFVGRDDLLKDIIRFFDDVRAYNSSTRLLAIKAPSGWGKSSFLVKLRSLCSAGRNKDKIFLYAVDCRTASSPRYPELALKRCFDAAISARFVAGEEAASVIPSVAQPFADGGVKQILNELKQKNKIIVLFFDQFEEITTKQELAELFVQIKTLCSAVESAGENVILGFSWKTDGTIPADHPAYHAWHSFKDRRKEFDLPLFSKGDISKLLNGLARVLNIPIEPGLRRLLAEHCQGYPWLLKKLCVHVFQVLRSSPAKQRELLDRALDIEALFNRDLADLTPAQIACLERVAKDSPADHFRMVEQFGESVIDPLVHRRLIVRNSGKLVLYWDIFRDFVLYRKVPAIPARYIPVSTPNTAKSLMERLGKSTSIQRLAKQMSLQAGTLDNLARDMVMMGVCAYDRKNERLHKLHDTDKAALSAAFKFFSSHVLLRKIYEDFGKDFRQLPLNSIHGVWASEFSNTEYAPKTVIAIGNRMIAWFQAFGILVVDSGDLVSSRPQQSAPTELGQFRAEGRKHRSRRLFLGEAPPTRVLELLRRMAAPDFKAEPTDRNGLYVLNGLRLITSTVDPILLDRPSKGQEELWLAYAVSTQSTVQATYHLFSKGAADVTAFDVGQELERQFGLGVSEGSLRRYGAGVLVWVRWLFESGIFRRHRVQVREIG